MTSRMVQAVLLFIGTVVSTTGCFPSTQRWDEDVQLSDGSVIQVKREVLYLPGHGEFHQTSGWIVGGERLTLVDPATNQRLIWEGTRRVAWYLDRRDDRFVLVGRRIMCDQHNTGQTFWGAYVLSPDDAREAPLSDLHPPLTANMVFKASSHETTSKWSHLKLAEKQRINDYATVPANLRVIDPKTAYPPCE